MIETALVLPVLVLMLCFAVDIGYFFIVAANLVSASRNAVLYSGQGFASPTQQLEGIRYAVVHGTGSTSCSGPSSGCGDTGGSNITAVVNSYAAISFHDTSGMTVTPSWPDGTSTPASRVVVTITYSYIPYLQVPGFNAPTMKVTAEGRIVF